MWWTTTVGFFSVVRKSGDDGLTVRARVRTDLDRLREGYLPELSPTQVGGGTDYPYRARVSHVDFARAAAAMVMDIDYSNFKSTVGKRVGAARARAYGRVWSVLYDLEGQER